MAACVKTTVYGKKTKHVQLKHPNVIELLQTSCIHLFIVTKQLVHLI